jgi:TonB family protein
MMNTAIDALTNLGASTFGTLWLPLAAWSVLWLAFEGGMRLSGRTHPELRYRMTQALLLALPMGIVAGSLLEMHTLLPAGAFAALLPEVVVYSSAGDDLVGKSVAETQFSAWAALPWMVLGIVLLAGAALGTIRVARLLMHGLALRAWRKRLDTSGITDLSDEILSIAAQLDVKRHVRLVESPIAEVPLTFGVLRPLIVLPASLEPEQRRLAILHEMVHIRQRDYAAKWLEALVEAVFTLHPGVHRLRRYCDLLRELACDSALLTEAGVSRRAYANLVYAFVSPPARLTPLSVGMADRPSNIHIRIHAMKQFRPSFARPARFVWPAAAAVLISGSLLLGASGVLAYGPDPAGVQPSGDERAAELRSPLAGGERHAFAGDSGWARDTVKVDQMPELIGGPASVQQRVVYPELARNAGIQGTVLLQFVVSEDGVPEEIEVIQGLGEGLDEAAARALAESRFEPGRHEGQPVRVKLVLPVRFRLADDDSSN